VAGKDRIAWQGMNRIRWRSCCGIGGRVWSGLGGGIHRNTQYLWLRNERDLSKEQQERLANLSDSHLKTAKAYQLKLAFQEFWKSSHRIAPLYLQIWYAWAIRSRIPDMVKAAKTIRKHAVGILRWFETKTTNGLIEAINGLIQAAKRKARGYRTTKNLIAMIYLIGAKFDL